MRLILVYLALIPMVCLAQDQSSNAAKPGMAAAGAAWMRIVRVDKMDDQAQTAYRVQALSDDHRSADILYLCKAGQLLGGIYNANVALAVDHVYGEQDFVDMQYRKDHFMPGEGWWSRTSDGSSLVIPQGQLRKMLEGQTLLIRATTVGGSVVEDERHGPTHVREGLRRPTMKRLLPPGRYLILCSLFCFAAPALAGSAPNEADYPTQYSVVNAIKLDSAWLASALGYDHLREGTIQVVEPQEHAFDAAAFLEKAGLGRKIVELKSRGAFFSQGSPADSIFYLQKGRAKLTVVSKNGKEATITLISPGDFVGEESIAGAVGLRLATATAITACTALKIERGEIIRVLHEEHAFSDLFLKFLLARSMRTQADLVDQLFNSSEKRLARILLLLAEFGKPGDPESLIPQITQETLAEMIGTTRSRVSFFMNRFRKLGFIEYNGRIRVHRSLLNVILHD